MCSNFYQLDVPSAGELQFFSSDLRAKSKGYAVLKLTSYYLGSLYPLDISQKAKTLKYICNWFWKHNTHTSKIFVDFLVKVAFI